MDDINEQLASWETICLTTVGPMFRAFAHAETFYAYLSFAVSGAQNIDMLIHFAEHVGEEHWA